MKYLVGFIVIVLLVLLFGTPILSILGQFGICMVIGGIFAIIITIVVAIFFPDALDPNSKAEKERREMCEQYSKELAESLAKAKAEAQAKKMNEMRAEELARLQAKKEAEEMFKAGKTSITEE